MSHYAAARRAAPGEAVLASILILILPLGLAAQDVPASPGPAAPPASAPPAPAPLASGRPLSASPRRPAPGSPEAIEAELSRIRADLRDIKALLRVMVMQMGIPTAARPAIAGRPGAGAAGQPRSGPLPVMQRIDEMETRMGEIHQVESAVSTIQNTLAENQARQERSQLVNRINELKGLLIDTAHSTSQEFGNLDMTLYFYLDGEPNHYDPAIKYAQELQEKVDLLGPSRDKLSGPERESLEQAENWGRHAKIVKGLAALSPGTPVLH